jgi:hypothetical protein
LPKGKDPLYFAFHPFPKWETRENKVGESGEKLGGKIRRSLYHNPPHNHHNFTTTSPQLHHKKPSPKRKFSQNPPQKTRLHHTGEKNR